MNEKTLRVLEFKKIKEMVKEFASSKLAKDMVDDLTPSSDYGEVEQSLKETSEASRLIIQQGRVGIGPIYNLLPHVKIAEIGSYLTPSQLLEVGDTLRTCRKLKKVIHTCNGSDHKFPILNSYAESITGLRDLEDTIDTAIIGSDELSDHASHDLRRIRRTIENKKQSIRKKLENIIHSQSNQKYLQDAIITIRQDRFVVPVKSEYKNMIKGLIHDQSSSGATLYIEPMAVVEVNNHLKELRLEERDEVIRILKEITEIVAENAEALKINQMNITKLDFIFAKGRLAVKHNGVEPELNREGFINIKKGRHPLIDPKEVVANTMWLGKDFKMLLITGPNTGGKTVTLKTVGLLVLMAQSGLHIPAGFGTTLPVFKQVFADIGDEQSIEQSLSTFSSHMTNIVNMLDNVDDDSLVLLDELGAGTDPTEGAALAIAILNKLYQTHIRTVATTHYNELKQYALTHSGIENASVEFDVSTLSPTYKLLVGVPGKSNAFEISRKLGLTEEVIESAKHFVEHESIEFEEVLTQIEDNRRTSENERDEAIRLRLEVEKMKKKWDEKTDKLSVQRERVLKNSKEEARLILKNAKEEAEEIIKDLRNLKSSKDKESNKMIEEHRKKLRDSMQEVSGFEMESVQDESMIPKNLKIGESIKILTLNQEGTVASLPDDNGEMMVQAGIMKVKINIKHIRRIKEVKTKGYSSSGKNQIASRSMTVTTEIDIRGNNIEDARMELEKYLDEAYLSNLPQVYIIHGKGTGVLRKGVKEYLRKHPHVKTQRDGAYNEGGNGVTVIEFK